MAKPVTKEEALEYIRRYKNESASSIAASVGRGTTTVQRAMLAHGGTLRTQAEAAELGWAGSPENRAKPPIGERHWNWKGGISKRPDLSRRRWHEQAAERMRLAGGKCEGCGRTATGVHHVNGEDDDRVGSLLAVCRWCHQQAHGNWPSDEDLFADYEAELTEKQTAAKYGVNVNTAAKYRHYARGFARGIKFGRSEP